MTPPTTNPGRRNTNSESAFHVMQASVMGDVLAIQAIRADGTVMDTFTKQKAAAASTR
ncbi:MAG: hypothetical protein HY678_10365 [Chloroflexi bacterium]|nr:hypothetical protein [Chloroflexota bacterium]